MISNICGCFFFFKFQMKIHLATNHLLEKVIKPNRIRIRAHSHRTRCRYASGNRILMWTLENSLSVCGMHTERDFERCSINTKRWFKPSANERQKHETRNPRFVVCVTPKQKKNIVSRNVSRIKQCLVRETRFHRNTWKSKDQWLCFSLSTKVSLINVSTMFCLPCVLSRNSSLFIVSEWSRRMWKTISFCVSHLLSDFWHAFALGFRTCLVVYSKRFIGSRPIDNAIKLQKGMIRIDTILCKTDIQSIHRLTCNCHIVIMILYGIQNFNKDVFGRRSDFLWWPYHDLNINRVLSELNTPHNLSLFFWARFPRRPYVGHANFTFELRVLFFSIIKSHWH